GYHGAGFRPPGVEVMRRIVCLLAGVLLVLPSLGSDSPKEYDGATQLSNIDGSWQLVMRRQDGQETVFKERIIWTFRKGEFINSAVPDGDKKTYKVTPTSYGPAHLDLGLVDPYGGELPWLCGVCQLDGDTLLIGMGGIDRKRPKGFSDARYVVVLRRTK